MHAAPQFARMVDERGVEVQQDYESLTAASELLPLNGKSDRNSDHMLHLAQQQQEGPPQRSFWPLAILLGLVVLAVGLVATVVALNPSVFQAEFHSHFMLVGDWGRQGLLNQSRVAADMARVASANRPDFIISVGDNFYEYGLLNTSDTAFETSFTNVYSAPSLQVPWHAVLGNHDYGECWTQEDCAAITAQCQGQQSCFLSPLHQLDVALWQRDRRWHCERNFQLHLGNGALDFFFIDTNPAITDYQTAVFANNTGGILSQSWQENLLELETNLARSTARWKLVIGHHPVRRNNWPDNNLDLLQSLEPILEQYQVKAYFSGHEHNLQYMHQDSSNVHYVITGGGSLTDYSPIQKFTPFENGGENFQYWGSGFVDCDLMASSLTCDFYGVTQAMPVYTMQLQL